MNTVILQLLAPLLLVPVLIWIGARYLPVLAGAGRARLYLLIFLCGGAVAVQVGMVHTQAYPLVTWTMYGNPAVEPTTWRFLSFSGEDVEQFRWEEVSSTRAVAAFERQLVLQASAVDGAEEEVEREEAKEEIRAALAHIIDGYNQRARHPPVDSVQVEHCELDIRRMELYREVPCRTLLTVRGQTAGAVDDPSPGAGGN